MKFYLTSSFLICFVFFSTVANSENYTHSEVIRVVGETFSNCNSINVVDTQVIDAEPINDDKTVVSLSITIQSQALQSNIALWQELSSRKDLIDGQYSAFDKRKATLQDELNNLRRELRGHPDNRSNEKGDEYRKMESKLSEMDKEFNQFYAAHVDIMKSKKSLYSEERRMKDKMAKNLLANCKYNNGMFGLSLLNFLFPEYENHTKNLTFQLMVKAVVNDVASTWRFGRGIWDTKLLEQDTFETNSDPYPEADELAAFEKAISDPDFYFDECYRIEKMIQMEQGGIEEQKASRSARSGCMAELDEIQECVKAHEVTHCYQSFYENYEGQ
jgi:hypothetical protein